MLVKNNTTMQETVVEKLKKTYFAIKMLSEKAIGDRENYGELSNLDKSILNDIEVGLKKEKTSIDKPDTGIVSNAYIYETPIEKVDLRNYSISESEIKEFFNFFFESNQNKSILFILDSVSIRKGTSKKSINTELFKANRKATNTLSFNTFIENKNHKINRAPNS